MGTGSGVSRAGATETEGCLHRITVHWMTVSECLRFVGGFYELRDGGLVTNLQRHWGLPEERIGSLSPGLRQRKGSFAIRGLAYEYVSRHMAVIAEAYLLVGVRSSVAVLTRASRSSK